MFCALCILCNANAAAESLNALLAHMRTAIGEPYRAHLVSTLHVYDSGAEHTLRSDAQGVRFYPRECVASVCAGTYFDGSRSFHVNFNGTALPDEPAFTAALLGARTVASFSFLDPKFGRSGSIADGGSTTYQGRAYRELVVTARGAHPMVVLVDPNTYLVAAVWDAATSGPVLVYEDYRRVGSFMMPFTIRRGGDVAERYDSRTTTTQPFDAPRGLVPTIAVNGSPLATDPGSVAPVGTCTIASVAVRCLLDTGNSGMSMSLELAEQLDLPAVGSYEANGLGNYSTEVVKAGPLTVGNAVFPEAQYVVLNDIHQYGYDLILGADIFANTRVEIDPAKHTVRFGVAPQHGAVTLPLVFENFVPMLQVQLGNVAADLAVDTGDASNINLAHAFYSAHTELFSPSQHSEVAGVGATSIEDLGRIATVVMGPYHLSSQPIGTTRRLAGTGDGHLGAAFFDHFTMILNYQTSTVSLTPREGDTAVKRQ
jgi:hypothetical protein